MALPKLQAFHVPNHIDEAFALLTQSDEALPLGGGTFLRGLEARGLLGELEALVDLRKVGLSTVRMDAAEFEIGASVTFARLAGMKEVNQAPWLGALADALTHPPVQVRNTATIGGCVAAACPFYDAPTALLALDARVIARSSAGERRMPLGDLFTGMFTNALAKGEIITAVLLPAQGERCASGFVKLASNANDLAIVNAAARLTVDAKGVCTEARLALGGGIGEVTTRSPAAEGILTGAHLDAAALHKAGEAVAGDIDPLADHRASAEYRTATAKVMARRALERALSRLERLN